MKQENPNQALEELILTIFKENHENYGYRRITLEIHNREVKNKHKKVYHLMKKLGLICVKYSHKTREYRSYKGKMGTIAKNRINRCFKTPYPYRNLGQKTNQDDGSLKKTEPHLSLNLRWVSNINFFLHLS